MFYFWEKPRLKQTKYSFWLGLFNLPADLSVLVNRRVYALPTVGYKHWNILEALAVCHRSNRDANERLRRARLEAHAHAQTRNE